MGDTTRLCMKATDASWILNKWLERTTGTTGWLALMAEVLGYEEGMCHYVGQAGG